MMRAAFAITLALAATGLVLGLKKYDEYNINDFLLGIDVHPHLSHLNDVEFNTTRELIPVGPDGAPFAYSCFGFALANMIFIEGPDAIIVVDSTEAYETCELCLELFRSQTGNTKPIEVVIWTHSHGDHFYGGAAISADAYTDPANVVVYAHENFVKFAGAFDTMYSIAIARGMKQFAIHLGLFGYGAELVNGGLGPLLALGPQYSIIPLFPNTFFGDGVTNTVLAGLTAEVSYNPGETDDQLMVHFPDFGLVIIGDNFYRNFPNLYAIRGVPPRDAKSWIGSVDNARALNPQYIIGSHHRPLGPDDNIMDTLTMYRDGISYVHDQATRMINMGAYPQEVARHLSLPSEYSGFDHLFQTYGTIEWGVRGIFDRYMGFFMGPIDELRPLSKLERAQSVINLAGGEHQLLGAARYSNDVGNYREALEHSSHVFYLGESNAYFPEARVERSRALKGLAGEESSSTGRNFFLSQLMEDWGLTDFRASPQQLGSQVVGRPISLVLDTMSRLLRAEDISGVLMTVKYTDTETGSDYFIQIRNHIMEVMFADPGSYDVTITGAGTDWRNIVLGNLSAENAELNSSLEASDSSEFIRFWGYFDSYHPFICKSSNQDTCLDGIL